MSEHENSSAGPRLVSNRTMDIVVALVLLAVAAVVIVDSLRLGAGWRPIEGPAAGYFPFYIGLLLTISSVVTLVRAFLDRAGGEKTFVTKPAFRLVLAVLVPLVVYIVVLGFIGIYVASAIYIALFMWYFGKYPILRGATIGVAVSVALFLMFEVWFLVPLPKGPFEEFLGY
ncbi:MAG: tripartite tricarboxylate transporter TctB family protein [Alphaproteobacteria bacterium]|nr:tripartite tricarboxylate transporter TctB family protein [Alphaproteobacteria bacterium]